MMFLLRLVPCSGVRVAAYGVTLWRICFAWQVRRRWCGFKASACAVWNAAWLLVSSIAAMRICTSGRSWVRLRKEHSSCCS